MRKPAQPDPLERARLFGSIRGFGQAIDEWHQCPHGTTRITVWTRLTRGAADQWLGIPTTRALTRAVVCLAGYLTDLWAGADANSAPPVPNSHLKPRYSDPKRRV
jgi:hypothetical protein